MTYSVCNVFLTMSNATVKTVLLAIVVSMTAQLECAVECTHHCLVSARMATKI
jgi:hypothetical protein